MRHKIIFLFFGCLIWLLPFAQTTRPVGVQKGRPVYNFTKINSKLQYVFIENKATQGHPQEGDDVVMRMIAICNNSFLYSSSQVNQGKPGTFSISKAAFEGDIADALMLMTPGDSIICLADAKAMYDYTKKKMPAFIKPGDKIQYNIRLISIKPKAELQKEREAALQQALQPQDLSQLADEAALKTYFNRNHINPVKTASGMYYSITREGKGELAKPGDQVVINYSGYLLDGTKFDSNTDSAFLHVQPLNFILGSGMVITGWEEGITYLKPGAKATLYIPSSMAYGSQSRPPSAANAKGIPPNSVLIFEMELLSVSHNRE